MTKMLVLHRCSTCQCTMQRIPKMEIRCKGTAFSAVSSPKISQSKKNYFFSFSYTWARDMPKISDVRSATCGQPRMI